MIDRRQLMTGIGAGTFLLASQSALASEKNGNLPAKPANSPAFVPGMGPRARVLIVNDLSGDADGLFSTVHAILSPSTEVCGIIGTRAAQPTETAKRSTELAEEMLRLMNLSRTIPVYRGADGPLSAPNVLSECPGARAIIKEAMRESDLPLYVTVGAGLTEIASALMLEPRIAERLTLIWIGGNPHEMGGAEYNLDLDREAARFIFNESKVPLWQVTSKAYGTCFVSMTELQAYVEPYGAIGAWLYAKIAEGYPGLTRIGANPGETWSMGDNPLVLLTALTGWIPSERSQPFRYERVGTPFDEVFAPFLEEDGNYRNRPDGRRMRVFNSVDTRLMFGDFFAKIQMNYGRER